MWELLLSNNMFVSVCVMCDDRFNALPALDRPLVRDLLLVEEDEDELNDLEEWNIEDADEWWWEEKPYELVEANSAADDVWAEVELEWA